MKPSVSILLCSVLFAFNLFAGPDPSKIYLVTNKNHADSAKVAELYCKLRNVPPENIIELDIRADASLVGKKYYFEKVENPLVAELVKRGAINATDLGSEDSYGRRNYAFLSHGIDFIILCKGVPWGVNPSEGQGAQVAPNTSTARSDAAAVDSELAARFLIQKTLDGQARNPLYGNYTDKNLYSSYGILRVARLDGASYADVENSLKKTIYAENNGLRGRAYIDKSQKAKAGDAWLDGAAKILGGDLFFDVDIDEAKSVFGFEERFDGAAFYFGWYAGSPSAFFKIDGFSLAPGGVGLHIYSFSARNMRAANNWTPNLVKRGVAFTVGNVYEPFLAPTHNPQKIMEALASGMCAGEAAYASVPVLGWQSLYVGDPLYMPFKVSLAEQIKNIESGKIDEYSQYAVVREMNKKLRAGDEAAALALAKNLTGKMPDAALLWKLLQIYQGKGDAETASKYADLLFERNLTSSPDFYGMAMALAKFLAARNKESAERAVQIYETLLVKENIPDTFERVLVARANAAAKKYSIPLAEIFAKKGAEHAEQDRIAAEKKAAAEAAKKSENK